MDKRWNQISTEDKKKLKRKKEEEKGKLLLPARVKEGELLVWVVSVKNSSRLYPRKVSKARLIPCEAYTDELWKSFLTALYWSLLKWSGISMPPAILIVQTRI